MLTNSYGYVTADRKIRDKDAFEEAQLNAQAQQDAGYKSKWQEQLDAAMEKILNREDFQYDLNGDAFYQQYKDKYTKQGQQAMMDTMGQQAALTGGFGNSWAETAGQQVYQGYLEGLNDIVPELYQLALDKYNAEGEELYNQYALYGDRDDRDFQRYQADEELKRWLAAQDEEVRNYYFNYGRMPSESDYNLSEDPYGGGYNILGGSGGSGGRRPSSSSSGGSLNDIAMAVIRGDYGNGEDRKKALAAAGYDPATVQKLVNKLIAGGALGDGIDDDSKGDNLTESYDEYSKNIIDLTEAGASKEELASALWNAYKNGEIDKETYEMLVGNFLPGR